MTGTALTKSRAKSYLKAIKACKKKSLSIAELSLSVGIFEDVVRDHFAHFDPMLRMLPDVNVMDYAEQLEEFVSETKTVKLPVKKSSKSKVVYKSIGDFVYKNMTIPGGIVDSSIDLSFEKLKELKRLVNEEYKAKKPK